VPPPSAIVRVLASLEQAPGLFALPEHLLRRLARRARHVDLGAQARLIEQGDRGDSLYVIERGTCLLAVETGAEHPVRVARLGEGDCVGETVLLDEPSPVSVLTLSGCSLFALDRPSLLSVLTPGSPGERELRTQFGRRQAGYREMASRARYQAPAGEATVTTVYGPKGGSGGTTIALNLGAQLARSQPGSVLVMDLTFPHNQAALMSGLTPTSSLTRASWTAAVGTMGDLEEALLSAAQPHPSGFMVLSGVVRVMEAELVTTEQVTRAIRTLRSAFRHIIVDLGVTLSDTALTVFDMADHVVLVVTPELPSLKAAQDVLQIFRDNLRIPEGRLTVLLNQRQANAVVPRDSVERVLGRPPTLEIGHDGNKPERAVLEGTVLALSDPKSEIARGTRRLAELLAAGAEGAGG